MNSCAASCCTCSPKVSCAFATSASWPTAAAPCRCRSAFSYSLRDQGRRPARTLQPPMVRKIFGAVHNVLAPWWSSNDSLPPKSSSVLHLFQSRLPHETTLYHTKLLRASARSVSLCPAALQTTSPYSLNSLRYPFHLPVSSVVLCRTASGHLDTAPSLN